MATANRVTPALAALAIAYAAGEIVRRTFYARGRAFRAGLMPVRDAT